MCGATGPLGQRHGGWQDSPGAGRRDGKLTEFTARERRAGQQGRERVPQAEAGAPVAGLQGGLRKYGDVWNLPFFANLRHCGCLSVPHRSARADGFFQVGHLMGLFASARRALQALPPHSAFHGSSPSPRSSLYTLDSAILKGHVALQKTL